MLYKSAVAREISVPNQRLADAGVRRSRALLVCLGGVGCLSITRYGSTMNRVAVLLGLSFFVASSCEALEIVCPEKILTSQRLDKQEAGWEAFVRPDGEGKVATYSYASGISVYSDDPKKIIELRPDRESAGEPSWSFSKAPPGTPPLYMACHYFDTRFQFIKALPANVKKCTAKRGGILQCDEFKP
jgi:hypothetical protein